MCPESSASALGPARTRSCPRLRRKRRQRREIGVSFDTSHALRRRSPPIVQAEHASTRAEASQIWTECGGGNPAGPGWVRCSDGGSARKRPFLARPVPEWREVQATPELGACQSTARPNRRPAPRAAAVVGLRSLATSVLASVLPFVACSRCRGFELKKSDHRPVSHDSVTLARFRRMGPKRCRPGSTSV